MTVRLVLGTLAFSGLRAVPGLDVEEAAREALTGFAAKLAGGRRVLRPPAFLSPPRSGETVEVEVDLDRASEEALRAEARRRGVELPVLGAHAVMLYLAELESLDDSLGSGGLVPPA